MLQPAMLSDLTVVTSWIASARDCQSWAGDRVRFPINPASLPEEIVFREANAYSLFDNGRLIAFGQLIPMSSNRGHLARLIVAPSFRRKGYGETLVRDLLAKAREAKFERVSLYVDDANTAAIELYTRFAFRVAPPPAGNRVFFSTLYMEHSIAEHTIAPRNSPA